MTSAELEAHVGSIRFHALLDDDEDGLADTSVVDSIIDQVRIITYSYLGERLDLPSDTDSIAQAQTYGLHIGGFLVWCHAPDVARQKFGTELPKSIELLYVNAIKGLQSSRRGFLTLTDSTGDTVYGSGDQLRGKQNTAKYDDDFFDKFPSY